MLIVNIGSLRGILPPDVTKLDGTSLGGTRRHIDSAWLLTRGDVIEDFGSMATLPEGVDDTDVVDAAGGWLFPSFCDSHTHIVYAGSREGEFEDKIRGLSYEEIARRGGGILNSADRLRVASDDELYESARRRLDEMIAKGTGAVEIKSGYGLDTVSELRMLAVIGRLRRESQAIIKATFLGAHAVAREYAGRIDAYVDMLCAEMLPAVAEQGIADFVDVFCDRGFFTPDHTARILEAAAVYGLKPKIHANELANSGGVQVGVAHAALSVDHLERMGADEIDVLRHSDTVATMLPGASFFLGMPYAPARAAVDAGLTVALASDYNPGSSPSGDMRFVASLGCIKMRLTPDEALAACTINGAAAMGLGDRVGAISAGRVANFFITAPLPSEAFVTYAYTTPLIRTTVLAGRVVRGES